jgi:1-acyl-sn-glycerol-3-phosphate acyltransferase
VPRLPDGPCVIVANHNSHADTAALIAALPAGRRPAVAAAADYWFGATPRGQCGMLSAARLRPWACQALCGAFPVRRGGGGTADLEAAAQLLAAGRDVVIYPEGSRSPDGSVGEFRHGAARLAVAAGRPLVPVAITGTRELLPAGKTGLRRRRGAVTVRIGVPVHATPATASSMTEQAREQVVTLARTGRGNRRRESSPRPAARARRAWPGTGRLARGRAARAGQAR